MLRSIKDMTGFKIVATDDEVGKLNDSYFNYHDWTVHYLVVETGGWLNKRSVLISPLAAGRPIWLQEKLPVELTRQQVESSPHVDPQQIISREQETELHKHYRQVLKTAEGGLLNEKALGMDPDVYTRRLTALDKMKQNPPEKAFHANPLRSANEIIGYHIQATDDDIGHVEDLFVNEESWVIHYLVIDTRNWLPGKKVLVASEWVDSINWSDQKVHVDLLKEEIKNSPEYNPQEPPNRAYESVLYEHYNRPIYWT